MTITKIDKIQRMGTEDTEKVGKMLVEHLTEKGVFKESNFKEDNTMSNSGSLYTTVLSKFIYTKEYDKFQKYFDVVLNLTPADLGMPEGAGAYKIPKIEGAQAGKLSPGEKVEYVNKNKNEVILETETYGIGTSISRRLIKRGAKGFVSKLMTSASNAVLRAVAGEVSNSMVAGASADNTVSTGISIDSIATARYNVESHINTYTNAPFGFICDYLILTSLGKKELTQSPDYKTIFGYGQMNVPGGEIRTQYTIYDGMNIVVLELMTAKKTNATHGMLVDSKNFLAFLKETDMEVFDGRIQGTAGDREIIHAMDAGMVILNSEAGSVIEAAS